MYTLSTQLERRDHSRAQKDLKSDKILSMLKPFVGELQQRWEKARVDAAFSWQVVEEE